MKENQRKCFKCGRSPSDDPNVKLFRFPLPGTSNILRCELWAKYCFPGDNRIHQEEFHNKLFAEHRMLCDKHFKKTSFFNYDQKKLHKYAVPEDEPAELSMGGTAQIATSSHVLPRTYSRSVINSSCQDAVPGPSRSQNILMEITNKENISQLVLPATKPASQLIPCSSGQSLEEIASKETHQTKHAATLYANKSPAHNVAKLTSVGSSANRIEASQSEKEKKLLNRCRRNLRKICSLQKEIRKLKKGQILSSLMDSDAVQDLSRELTGPFAVLLQGQLMNCKKKKKGRRWNLEQKILALRLYKRSPTCYRLLRRLFSLPCQTTLKNLLNKLPLRPGINMHVFDTLKKIAQRLKPEDNEYCLLFDGMSIRKHLSYNIKEDQIDGFQDHGKEQGRDQNIACHAIVFMLNGIRRNVKQPVAYYLSGEHVSADRLTALIKEVLAACFKAGIAIAATVCDMDGKNRKALSGLGANIEHPYFTYQDKEIIALYDTPHLLKCFRNSFLKYDVQFTSTVECNGKPIANIAKWSYIQQFFDMDNSNPFFVFAPVLTKKHLNPNTKEKMRVNLAAQVLSHTVSAGMYAKITEGELPTEALGTVHLIDQMDKIFDSLNANSTDLKRGKKYSTNISDRSPHFKIFDDMKRFFKTCKFIGAPSRAPSLDGWIQTIVGVERLYKNMTQKYSGIGSISTRRLQQDALENCFGCIRQNCGSNCNPTVPQFVAALKTGIISNLSSPTAAANCEDDQSGIIDNLRTFLIHTNSSPEKHLLRDASSIDNYADMDDAPVDENTGEVQACSYVCGYIIKRMELNCKMCIEAMTSPTDSVCHLFTTFKEYEEKRSLNYANIEMVTCVEKGARLVNEFLVQNAYKAEIKKKLKELISSKISFDFLDKCCQHKTKNIESISNSIFHININRFCVKKNRLFSENAASSSLRKKMAVLKHV